MTGTATAFLAEGLDVIEGHGQAVEVFIAGLVGLDPRKMNQRIEKNGSVSAGEDKAIAIGPVGLLRIVTKDALPQRVSRRRRSQWRAGMAGVGFLDRYRYRYQKLHVLAVES